MKEKRKNSTVKGLCISLLLAGLVLTACGKENPTEVDGSEENHQTVVSGDVMPESNTQEDDTQGDDTQGEKEPDDFSMPIKEKVKLDGSDFANVEIAREQMGYAFKPVEEFSNGYRFKWLQVPDENTMVLTYEKDRTTVDITISKEILWTEYPEAEAKRVQADLTFGAVTVKHWLYVQINAPNVENWRDLLTEEERNLLDAGIANTGTDGEQTTVDRQDHHTYKWQQKEAEWICVQGWIEIPRGEDADFTQSEEQLKAMEEIIEEWITLNSEGAIE